MGIKTWFRRRFIVPRVWAEVDKALKLTKGTTMNFLKGKLTILSAVGALLLGIVAFSEGTISVMELLALISAAATALGIRRAIANAVKDIEAAK